MKASYFRSRMKLDTGAGAAQLRQGLNELSALPAPGLANALGALDSNLRDGGPANYVALATMYETGPWTFIAEGSQVNVPRSPLSARRGYVSAGYRQGAVTYYGIASRVKPTKGAAGEPALAGYAVAAGNNYRYDQTTANSRSSWQPTDVRRNRAGSTDGRCRRTAFLF